MTHLKAACPKLTTLELDSVHVDDACLRALQPLNLSDLSFSGYDDFGGIDDENTFSDDGSLFGSEPPWEFTLVGVTFLDRHAADQRYRARA